VGKTQAKKVRKVVKVGPLAPTIIKVTSMSKFPLELSSNQGEET